MIQLPDKLTIRQNARTYYVIAEVDKYLELAANINNKGKNLFLCEIIISAYEQALVKIAK